MYKFQQETYHVNSVVLHQIIQSCAAGLPARWRSGELHTEREHCHADHPFIFPTSLFVFLATNLQVANPCKCFFSEWVTGRTTWQRFRALVVASWGNNLRSETGRKKQLCVAWKGKAARNKAVIAFIIHVFSNMYENKRPQKKDIDLIRWNKSFSGTPRKFNDCCA